jgi:hypothetical protein
MSGGQIDSLCRDWLDENYGEEIASQYTTYSLVIPQWNSADLNDALDHLRLMLCRAFGPEQSFREHRLLRGQRRAGIARPHDSCTGCVHPGFCHELRRRLKMPVYANTFAGAWYEGQRTTALEKGIEP